MSTQDRTLIVGILGDAGAGKDTLARVLTAVYPSRTLRFADALRDTVVHRLNKFEPGSMTRARLDADLDNRASKDRPSDTYTCRRLGTLFERFCPDEPMSPRDALRAVGYAEREKSPNVFVDAVASQLRAICTSGDVPVVAIPDVRFSNEAAAVKRAGGYLVRVRHRQHTASNRPEEIAARALPVDREVTWDGTIETIVEEASVVIWRGLEYRSGYEPEPPAR